MVPLWRPIIIDTVLLACAEDSMLLQQAAHLTGGLYLRAEGPTQRALGQYLLTCCLPDKYERQYLAPPVQGEPESRALCFVTKQPVEMGYACSVCLTVFSHDGLAACPVCGTRYALAMPPGAGQARKRIKRPAAAAPGAAAPAAAAAQQ